MSSFRPGTLLPPLAGYATRFGVAVPDGPPGWKTVIRPEAFDACLADGRQIYAVMSHGERRLAVGDVDSGTLLIDADAFGVFCIVLSRNDGPGREAVQLVAAGHLGAMSISFRFHPRHIDRDERQRVEAIRKATIDEVSFAMEPRMPGTVIRVAAGLTGIPTTAAELIRKDIHLREQTIAHREAGTLDDWRERKANERIALLGIRGQINRQLLREAG